MAAPPLRIEPLGPQHDRASFACGADSLDRYLHDRVLWDESADVTACHVAVAPSAPEQIVGYFTLNAVGIELQRLPPRLAKRLPQYATIPAILLGRLAVDHRFQGQGLGRFLLFEAFRKVIEIRQRGGAWCVVVDALDERAATFYEQFNFERFPGMPLRLFIPLRKVRRLLSENGADSAVR